MSVGKQSHVQTSIQCLAPVVLVVEGTVSIKMFCECGFRRLPELGSITGQERLQRSYVLRIARHDRLEQELGGAIIRLGVAQTVPLPRLKHLKKMVIEL